MLDVLVATAGTYIAVSQLLEGFSWRAVAILATLAGVNIFAAFKLGTNGRFKFSSTAAAGAVMLAWIIYVSTVSGVGALAVIGMVVGCAQIVIAARSQYRQRQGNLAVGARRGASRHFQDC